MINLDDTASKVFHGLKLDAKTGRLTAYIGQDAQLPRDGVVEKNPYFNYGFTSNTIRYSINAAGHFVARVL